jgi:hypothetical protein
MYNKEELLKSYDLTFAYYISSEICQAITERLEEIINKSVINSDYLTHHLDNIEYLGRIKLAIELKKLIDDTANHALNDL